MIYTVTIHYADVSGEHQLQIVKGARATSEAEACRIARGLVHPTLVLGRDQLDIVTIAATRDQPES